MATVFSILLNNSPTHQTKKKTALRNATPSQNRHFWGWVILTSYFPQNQPGPAEIPWPPFHSSAAGFQNCGASHLASGQSKWEITHKYIYIYVYIHTLYIYIVYTIYICRCRLVGISHLQLGLKMLRKPIESFWETPPSHGFLGCYLGGPKIGVLPNHPNSLRIFH